ncbi:MAG TPA: hypothetical protein VNT26_18475 [Candidatus Sulfotelmatobacter sp.]|nr:hypothetical protein [Candidatus Sulfotelmatobacter sp.]
MTGHAAESPPASPEKHPEANPAAIAPAPKAAITVVDFTLPIRPIAELVSHPEFPQSALGQHVDIGGFTGVVVEIVKHSLRVRPATGHIMSYNFNTLRRLYGPPPPPEPAVPSPAAPAPVAPAPRPRRDLITEPNFDAPVKSIEEFVNQPDYPKCVYGEHIDLRGYAGVVVEIVNGSLKVRSLEGATRSYNAEGLRKLYGKSQPRSFT